ncbi:MAG TPA: hypothetical protein PK926_04255 [Spirochaetota bacterium]|nr:hypothetical protein [Spirochaetota bacterium]HPI89183.1 hypothetical protein [Spirochaetota bacterium]HPR46822.1 hypothetical protein [Spirochaetota bacterium]
MEDIKYIKKLLSSSEKYAIDIFRDANFSLRHKPFEGTPKKHPTDDNILVLISDPFSRRSKFYEFSVESIGTIEEIGTRTSDHGESAYFIRVWIKKGLTALKTEPFIVE